MPKKVLKTSKALFQFDLAILKTLAPGWILVGCDEVGRGSLIGPVVAAAVSFPHPVPKKQLSLLASLNDSKQLKPEIRSELEGHIRAICCVGVGQASKEEVDKLNVHHASLLAIYRAYADWQQHADEASAVATHLILDGRALLPEFPRHRQQAIIKGDGLSAAIAASSIIAKEYRDRMIRILAQDFPHYGWERNMGYGTPTHLAALHEHGPTPLHRVNYQAVQANSQLFLEIGTGL